MLAFVSLRLQNICITLHYNAGVFPTFIHNHYLLAALPCETDLHQHWLAVYDLSKKGLKCRIESETASALGR